MGHESDSLEQRVAEPLILAEVELTLGVELVKASLDLPGGSRVEIDGAAPDGSAFVEVFAHQGRLKGGQVHKVARDALKLITVARSRPVSPDHLIIAFADDEAAACVGGKSWLSEALGTWGIEVFIAELDAETRAGLLAAQARQVMVNPSHLPS